MNGKESGLRTMIPNPTHHPSILLLFPFCFYLRMGQWEPSEVLIRLLLIGKRLAEIISLPLPHFHPNYFLFEATQNLNRNCFHLKCIMLSACFWLASRQLMLS